MFTTEIKKSVWQKYQLIQDYFLRIADCMVFYRMELHRQRDMALATKKNLRAILKDYENGYMAMHGRYRTSMSFEHMGNSKGSNSTEITCSIPPSLCIYM